MEPDLLQHVARCPALEDLDVFFSIPGVGGSGEVPTGCSSDLLQHVPALAACAQLVRLSLHVHELHEADIDWEEATAYTAQALLDPLASLPRLREVSASVAVLPVLLVVYV